MDGLTEEDDEIVDVWYLLGWLNKLRSENESDEMYLGNAKYYLNKAKMVHVKNPTKDKEMVIIQMVTMIICRYDLEQHLKCSNIAMALLSSTWTLSYSCRFKTCYFYDMKISMFC